MAKINIVSNVKVMANTKKDALLREDFKNQLENKDKFESYFENLVEDYIFYSNLKDALQRDIRKTGVRYKKTTGNGFKVDTPNENVRNIMQVTTLMLKILNDLGLQEPDVREDDTDEDIY